MSRRTASADIDDQAAHWAARVDRGPLTTADQARLDLWLALDPRHLGAYARAQAIMMSVEASADAQQTSPIPPLPRRRVMSRRGLIWGGAIAAAAGVAGTAGLLSSAAALEYRTGRGEVRLVPLSDGSSMTLNTVTTVRVRYAPNERRVELLAGEALFTAVRNPGRPFLVEAADNEVRTLGDTFAVRRLSDSVVQVVVHGGEAELLNRRTHRHTRLAANMSAVAGVGITPASSTLSPTQVRRALAWREGLIAFEGESLAEAAQEFARYSDTRIVIDDPAVARSTITGLFAANDPVGFAQAAALSLDLKADRQPGLVRLHSK